MIARGCVPADVLTKRLLLLVLLVACVGSGAPATAAPAAGAAACPRAVRAPRVLHTETLTADIVGPPLVDAASGHVFLANGGGGLVWMFDACSGMLAHTTTVGTVLYASALDSQRGHLIVAESSPAPALAVTAIAMLDTRTGALLRTFALPRTSQYVYQPRTLALSAASGQVWVLSMCSPPNPPPTAPPCPNAVSALDPRTGTFRQVATLGALEIPRHP